MPRAVASQVGSAVEIICTVVYLIAPLPVEPVPGLTVVQFRNHHLGYALTWFVLAAMTAGAAWRVWRWHCQGIDSDEAPRDRHGAGTESEPEPEPEPETEAGAGAGAGPGAETGFKTGSRMATKSGAKSGTDGSG